MRNWLPQTGIGIELRDDGLRAFCLRRLWGRARITGRLEIAGISELGPAKCGTLYRQFLRNNGLKNPWTVVALPRSMVLWRQLQLPGSLANDLRSAVEFQVDSLHPFEEGGVWWDFAIPGRGGRQQLGWLRGAPAVEPSARIDVWVAMARKETVEQLADWFRQSGIPISQFIASTGLFLALLERVRGSDAAFLLHAQADQCELAGVSPAGAVVSREIRFEPNANAGQRVALVARELELARSEMRLEPGDGAVVYTAGKDLEGELLQGAEPPWPAAPVEKLLDGVVVAGAAQGAEVGENIIGIAAAQAAVERAGALTMNLLPAERRSYRSPAVYVPTYALAVLVILLAVALGLRAPVQDWLYSRSLERQRQALLPQIQDLERHQEQDRQVYDRLSELAQFNRSAGMPLELLDELTRLLPPDAWLQGLQYDGNAITMSGSASSASAVLQALANSNQLQSPQFLSAVTRSNDGKEGFRIGARLRAPIP